MSSGRVVSYVIEHRRTVLSKFGDSLYLGTSIALFTSQILTDVRQHSVRLELSTLHGWDLVGVFVCCF